MGRILINGISARLGGGRSVLQNLLTCLGSNTGSHDYVAIVPSNLGYELLATDRLKIIPHRNIRGPLSVAIFILFYLPHILMRERYDLILNAADIVVPSPVKQVFLFDWPYAAFPDSTAWRSGGFRMRVVRALKLSLFRWHLPYVTVMIAQTRVLAKQLSAIYGLRNVEILPNAVSLENMAGGVYKDFRLGGGVKFLCLSAYYSHKNLEILVSVARALRDEAIPAKIIITIAAEQDAGAARVLAAVEREGLGQFIHNIGPVEMIHVPSLYAQSDALILPTLLESFSGTYVEAMFHQKPIITSNLPFARDVCEDAALYFDPNDARDVTRAIVAVVEDDGLRRRLVGRGVELLKAMPDWHTATDKLISIIDKTLLDETEVGGR